MPNFNQVYKYNPCLPCCSPGKCATCDVVEFWTVSFSGITSTSNCHNFGAINGLSNVMCEAYNATFEVPFVGFGVPPDNFPNWHYEANTVLCGCGFVDTLLPRIDIACGDFGDGLTLLVYNVTGCPTNAEGNNQEQTTVLLIYQIPFSEYVCHQPLVLPFVGGVGDGELNDFTTACVNWPDSVTITPSS
jgi:hypothetical protein